MVWIPPATFRMGSNRHYPEERRSFGVRHYGSIYGALGVAGSLSTATSFVFFGKVHDMTGSYDLALTVGIVAFALGAIAFTLSEFSRRPH